MEEDRAELIASRMVVDIRDGNKKREIKLYLNQLELLLKKVRENPEIERMMREECGLIRANPAKAREELLRNGSIYESDLRKLAESIGIDHFVSFQNVIVHFLHQAIEGASQGSR